MVIKSQPAEKPTLYSSRQSALRAQYRRMESRPSWRAIKVVYAIIAVLEFIAFLPRIASAFDDSSLLGFGYIAGLGVDIALFYWLVRRLAAYVAFGKPEYTAPVKQPAPAGAVDTLAQAVAVISAAIMLALLIICLYIAANRN